MKRYIYVDHAATTPLCEAARRAMMPYLTDDFANPSTLYGLARNPRKAIGIAREQIANAIGALPDEIVFTSGGTESDNMALKGTAFRYYGQDKRIITSSIEHHAILHSCSFLQKMNYDVVYLPVDQYGIVNAAVFENAITDNTILASIMLANNEIGTIEPIHELAEIAHRHGVLFHTDAVQAIGHIPVDVNALNVDMLSASAHKFGGPKGIGFIYIRKGTPIEALINGGGQERDMRAGTENVAGIVGMAAALSENLKTLKDDVTYVEGLRAELLNRLSEAKLDHIVNGSPLHLPGSLSLSFKDISGEMLLHRLDLMGIAVATGSACNSRETVISHVIQAIHVPLDYSKGTIRITLGKENNSAQIEQIAASLVKIINHG